MKGHFDCFSDFWKISVDLTLTSPQSSYQELTWINLVSRILSFMNYSPDVSMTELMIRYNNRGDLGYSLRSIWGFTKVEWTAWRTGQDHGPLGGPMGGGLLSLSLKGWIRPVSFRGWVGPAFVTVADSIQSAFDGQPCLQSKHSVTSRLYLFRGNQSFYLLKHVSNNRTGLHGASYKYYLTSCLSS